MFKASRPAPAEGHLMVQRMKAALPRLLISSLLVAVVPAPVHAAGDVLIQLPFGSRQMSDEETWERTRGQSIIGASIDFGSESWLLHPVIGLFGSTSQGTIGSRYGPGTDVRAVLVELSIGARKTWHPGRARPFIEAGVTNLVAEKDFERPKTLDVEDSDRSLGAYLQAGVYWRPGARVNVGLSLRYVTGTSLDYSFPERITGDGDYFQGGLVLGWGWPLQ